MSQASYQTAPPDNPKDVQQHTKGFNKGRNKKAPSNESAILNLNTGADGGIRTRDLLFTNHTPPPAKDRQACSTEPHGAPWKRMQKVSKKVSVSSPTQFGKITAKVWNAIKLRHPSKTGFPCASAFPKGFRK